MEPSSFINGAKGFSMLKNIGFVFWSSRVDRLGIHRTLWRESDLLSLWGWGYHVAMFNQLLTTAIRKSAIRKTKTDKVDAFLIAKSLMIAGHIELKQTDIKQLKLKGLCKSR